MKCSIIVFIAGFIFGAVLCYGQTPATTEWSILASIDPGHKVRVETSMKKHTGTFAGASGEAITLNTKDGQLSISRADVVRVYSQSKSNRVRNALIGAGVGTALGVVSYATFGTTLRNEGAENTGLQLVIAPLGGAAVGALIPTGSMKKIYDASRP
jgi:hypothetical protein